MLKDLKNLQENSNLKKILLIKFIYNKKLLIL